ncbi:uncharacterized protein [Bemisia tabaci]|uniref:uncharacterized protein n=1 Tax=Bemisia tabaci TaxID=7038 RepID=UPI003B287C27
MAGDQDSSGKAHPGTPKSRESSPAHLAELAALKADRERIFSATQSIADIFTSELSEKNYRDHERSLLRIQKLQADFDAIQSAVLKANVYVVKDDKVPVTAVQKSYDELVRSLEKIYQQKSRRPETSNGDNAVGGVRLPRLELPTFSGDYSEWTSFYNLYKATIHDNEKLKPVEKLHYLTSKLRGEALELIKNIEAEEDQYAVAWDLLIGRYQNTRKHISHHFFGLLDMPFINSDKDIPNALTQINKHKHALRALGYDSKDYGPMVVAVVLRKLSPYHKKRFEDSRTDSTVYPTLEDVMNFLEKENAKIDDVSSKRGEKSSNDNRSQKKALYVGTNSRSRSNANQAEPNKSAWRKGKGSSKSQNSSGKRRNESEISNSDCPCCQEKHPLFLCAQFKAKKTEDRRKIVESLKRCVNCLSPGDCTSNSCKSSRRCYVCDEMHHTLLHRDKNYSMGQEDKGSSKKVMMGTKKSTKATVMFATVLVRVKTHNSSKIVRAVLDSAAQGTFITTECTHAIGLPIVQGAGAIQGISSLPSSTRGTATVTLSSVDNKVFAREHELIILDKITDFTPSTFIHDDVQHLVRGLPMADPEWNQPGPVDLLIGADLFPVLIIGKPRPLGTNMPYLIETRLGHVLMGSAPTQLHPPMVLMAELEQGSIAQLSKDIQNLWQIETIPSREPTKPPDDPAEIYFRENVERLPNGQFSVRLPFAKPPSALGESYPQALRRFLALERRFKHQPEFHKLYVEFMDEYQKNGVMTLAPDNVMEGSHCFLPHHGVIKETSSTTKLRVVFDASAKTSTGESLNSVLHTGPSLLKDIRDVLMGFRRHKVVFSCDIRQMYLQIALHPEDRRYHLVLWRPNKEAPVQIYQLNRVTFGVGSSSFLSSRSLIELATLYKDRYPRASKLILEDIFCDDVISGDRTVELTRSLIEELIALLKEGNFALRKWTSNDSKVLEGIADEDLEVPFTWEDPMTSSFSMLGLHWLPRPDAFSYRVDQPIRATTKRAVLSAIAKIYDILGWVSPVTFLAKTYMQQLWLLKLGWDEPLPGGFQTKWDKFMLALSSLRQVRIPRLLALEESLVQLHAFCDASEAGYATCIYIRTNEPPHDTNLVTARTRVAPLKKISLPRLELCGATVLADLTDYVTKQLDPYYNISGIHAWTDSKIVLQWIQTPSYKLKTFVANRVSHIQELLSNVIWHHVPSKDNPADCASRGLLASELLNQEIWWKGPTWLREDSSQWPAAPLPLATDSVPESKNLAVLLVSKPIQTFSKYSSWTRTKRVLAYILRAITPKKSRCGGELTMGELKKAELQLFRKVQEDCFQDDLLKLKKIQDGVNILCAKPVQTLSPYLDEDGLIRVGGRLKNADLAEGERHPILLSGKHHLTQLLIREYHKDLDHPGTQTLQSLLTRQFWITGARRAIQHCVHQCLKCFRARPRNSAPLMGDLPAPRVTPSSPFTHTGMDFAGPFSVKTYNLRSARTVQSYICIFVCFSTKAVHIESVHDLTSNSFIAALRRFTARRGCPTDLYSDCGTNFVGADNALKKLISQESNDLSEHALARGIKFHFNPPAAPFQGGLWERAVRSMKEHFKRIVGDQKLQMDEFQTVLCRIEAILNSRPLTPMSNDPNDLEVLTPGHFLIGRPVVSPPEEEHGDTPLPRLKRWKYVEALSQQLWKRWCSEYLQTLQKRNKWLKTSTPLKEGDLVLIEDPQLPTLCWKRGRVLQTFPGKDGQVRVATVRTPTGELKRPVLKLFRLPAED